MEQQFGIMEELLEEEESRERFRITDDAAAEWAVRKIAEAQNDLKRWKAHFKAQLDAVSKRCEETEAFFSAALEEYFDTLPRKATKTSEKYVLPGAELIRKKQAPEFVRDDRALTAFLVENDLSEFVKIVQSPDWASLKKRCVVQEDGTVVEQESGLVVDGVRAESRPEKFEVKLND